MPSTSGPRLPSAARSSKSSRRRMSMTVTMRPRRLSRPAISVAASGTRVNRSGMNTSCTRPFGRPNSWPPIVAVTYSMTFSPIALIAVISRCPAHVGGLLLERRDQARTIELGDVIVQADALAALDCLARDQRGKPDDRQLGGARIAAQRGGELEAVHARHLEVGDHHVEAFAGGQQRQRIFARVGRGD